ncbi:hypothetical protein N0V90_010425 [Kalmusia sp. IMI 367209]|nr:hypothetical protein N0V90_010425 [Kalmusia sp. IMI 367209]
MPSMANNPTFSASSTWESLFSNIQNEVTELRREVNSLKTRYDNAVASNTALIAASAKAEAAKAEAEKKATIARDLFNNLRTHHSTCDGNMDWEHGVALEQEVDDLKEKNKDLRARNTSLEDTQRRKNEELEAAGTAVNTLKAANKNLEQRLDEEKSKLEQQKKDAADIKVNLDTAYADLERKDADNRVLRKQKDDIDAARHELELKLHDAEQLYQQSQNRVAELESQKTAIEELEQDNATLQTDVDNLQERLNEHDRTILVKDARINRLEEQIQRALLDNLKTQRNAEDLANAATSPISAEPLSSLDVAQSESLEAELENASDASDFGAEFEPEPVLELANVTSIVDIAPIDAPQIATSSTQTEPKQPNFSIAVSSAAHVAPVEPQKALSTAETQTEPPELTHIGTSTVLDLPPILLKEQAIQMEQPRLTLTRLSSTHVAPVEPVKTKLTHVGTSTVLDYPPVVIKEQNTQTDAAAAIMKDQPTQTDPSPIPSPTVSKKRGVISISTAMAIFFALLSLFYFMENEALQNYGSHGYTNRLYINGGPLRRGRHLFGMFPLCYEEGSTWATEAMCQQFASGVKALESWAGIEYPVLW